MGIRLGEAAVDGVVVAGAEVVLSGFGIVVLAAVAEGVGVVDILDLFVAEGIVGVGFGDCAGSIGQVDHIAVGVVEVIAGFVIACATNQICTAEIGGINGAAVLLGHHIAAVQQVGDGRQIGLLAGADALRVVAIGIGAVGIGGACQLVEVVVGIAGIGSAADGFGQHVAVGIMSIADGFTNPG